mmetsp:Transcript_60844/g.145006  ORF Transcript_60844/g.145006 Transcript_60844/m.145006 type:complete len:118 (-) Transcript_60844:129-482(-)
MRRRHHALRWSAYEITASGGAQGASYSTRSPYEHLGSLANSHGGHVSPLWAGGAQEAFKAFKSSLSGGIKRGGAGRPSADGAVCLGRWRFQSSSPHRCSSSAFLLQHSRQESRVSIA